EWCRQCVYRIEPGYNPEDRAEAFKKELEWGERIPIGIIYKNNRQILEDRMPAIKDLPLVRQPLDKSKSDITLKEFY
ncbi:MAG: 2-oxoacid ferredoxin oxidoreductase, partial [Nitrospirota bacterium]|nr:2-oxoacid ferredoxin oxidoreductase [Nitrospirota bacterium]